MNPTTTPPENGQPAAKKHRYKGRRSAQDRDAATKKKGRLPHRSQFILAYDATTATWEGGLMVPVSAEGPEGGTEVYVTFAGSMGPPHGLFYFAEVLDDRYRAWAQAIADGQTCTCIRTAAAPAAKIDQVRGNRCETCGRIRA